MNSEQVLRSKYHRFEKVLIKATWFFIIITSLYYFMNNLFFTGQLSLSSPAGRNHLINSIAVCTAIFLLNLLKYCLYRTGRLENKYVYYADKIVWIVIISLLITRSNIGEWVSMLLLLPIVVTCLIRGPVPGVLLVSASLIINTALLLVAKLPLIANNLMDLAEFRMELLSIAAFHTIVLMGAILTGMLYESSIDYDIENKKLVEQLEEKYRQLEDAQTEIRNQNDALKSTNAKLEEANNKLSASIAEFYTLQQISQAISSILDIKELLKYLNDIIIGVMGVSFSTILLYDDEIKQLKVHTTNIINPDELGTMVDHINEGVLLNVMDNGQSIMINSVDPDEYTFTQGREIHSMICIPLNSKSRKYGLVLVEHTYTGAFDEENVRLLSIIAQQVGIVMENAELYNRMSGLARKDGLTGIFNRQYFQERLHHQFQKAKEEDCPISLAIFDIDQFKKFNDTFGHLFGDKVLASIAASVSEALRRNDIFARYGGEEFIILMPEIDMKEACRKIEELRERISLQCIQDNLIMASVTASFGISCYPECALTEHELLRTADNALYQAKASGRNCIGIAKKRIS